MNDTLGNASGFENPLDVNTFHSNKYASGRDSEICTYTNTSNVLAPEDDILLYPTPYDLRGIVLYLVGGTAIYLFGERVVAAYMHGAAMYVVDTALLVFFTAIAVWRENIDIKGLIMNIVRRRQTPS